MRPMKHLFSSALLMVLLFLVSCSAPSVSVQFAIPPEGMDLSVPSLPMDIMVLSPIPPEEGELAEKLEKAETRSKWFNEQDPELKRLRNRLRRQGKLASIEVRDGQTTQPDFTLNIGEHQQGARLAVVADIPVTNNKDEVPVDTTDILEVKLFSIRLVGNQIEVKPMGTN